MNTKMKAILEGNLRHHMMKKKKRIQGLLGYQVQGIVKNTKRVQDL
jgi:hypothetical protein